MTNRTLKQRLAQGDLLIGSVITLPSPEIAEIFCQSGFDWLFIDLEHSVLGVKEAQVLLQAASFHQAHSSQKLIFLKKSWLFLH